MAEKTEPTQTPALATDKLKPRDRTMGSADDMRGHAAPSGDQVDRIASTALGEMAQNGVSNLKGLTDAEKTDMADAKDVVGSSFHWINDAAQDGIDKLKGDLEKEDEPPWTEQLAEAAVHVALLAGGAAAGELIAGKILGEIVEHASKHEFVKGLFEEGINRGVQAGESALRGKGKDVIGAFINSQKQAVREAHIANQSHWTKVGRHKVQSLDDALALEAACDRGTATAAGDKQYEATRDAWVGYLAQSKYGFVVRELTQGDVHRRPVLTNMRSQDNRDRANRSAPGYMTEPAPDARDAFFGHAPGLLSIGAELPAIEADGTMHGTPVIAFALLNGLNDTIREQYEGKPVASMNIPRQIIAKVDGNMPNFTLSLDEAGTANPLTLAQGAWMRSRAVVGHPQYAAKDDPEKQRIGMRALLNELVPDEIKEKM